MFKSIASHIPDELKLKHSLFYQWMIVNSFGFALIVVALLNGWIAQMMEVDQYMIIPALGFIFLWGVFASGLKAYQISNEISLLKKSPSLSEKWVAYRQLTKKRSAAARPSIDRSLELKLSAELQVFSFIRSSLIMLGFIGTIVGLVVGTSKLDPKAFGDITQAAPAIGQFIEAYSLALYTTLLGGLTWIWTSYNFALLTKGSTLLLASIYEAVDDYKENTQETKKEILYGNSDKNPVPLTQEGNTDA